MILTPRGRAGICILPLPDVHAHFTSEPHWSRFLDLAGRNRNDITDVVNIGDWGDYYNRTVMELPGIGPSILIWSRRDLWVFAP